MIVMPVQTSIQASFPITNQRWIPACAGMTDGTAARLFNYIDGLHPGQRANVFRLYVPILTLRLRAFAGDTPNYITYPIK
jgi:hypothetical protein